MPSRDFTSEDLVSSRMMSLHSSTHSSQMNTVGPAISLRTSGCDFPQKGQWGVLLLSPPLNFVIKSTGPCPFPSCQRAILPTIVDQDNGLIVKAFPRGVPATGGVRPPRPLECGACPPSAQGPPRI